MRGSVDIIGRERGKLLTAKDAKRSREEREDTAETKKNSRPIFFIGKR
jgi:hypothetical protein